MLVYNKIEFKDLNLKT